MATSSKVQFNLDTLKEKALESIDFRIGQKRIEVEAFGDQSAQDTLVRQWRAKQEERVSDLFRRLGDDGVSDKELATFKIQPIPEVDNRERSRAVHDLSRLETLRSQIIAKAESLVADEDGNIALTKTQLSEFFAL